MLTDWVKWQGNYLCKILFSLSLSWHLSSHLSISSLSCSSICTSRIQVGLCSGLPDFGCRNLSVWSGHSKRWNFQSPTKRALPNSVKHSWTSHKISYTFLVLIYQTTAGIFYSVWVLILVACFVCLFACFFPRLCLLSRLSQGHKTRVCFVTVGFGHCSCYEVQYSNKSVSSDTS